MTRRATAPSIVLLFVLAGACSSPFAAGGGADGGSDAPGEPGDAAADGSGGADGGGGSDAGDGTVTDAPVHPDAPGLPDAPSIPDAPFADVVDEPPPPTCSGAFACVPAAPSGWQGPVELYRGSGAAPACTADFAGVYDGNDSLETPAPATCSCTCGLSQTTCAPRPLSYWNVATCPSPGTSCFSTTLTPGACTTVTASPCTAVVAGPVYFSSPVPTPSNPSCGPQPGTTLTPVQWGIDGRACAPTVQVAQVDCTSGSVCAPQPASPYGSKLCVTQAGDLACPSGPYSSRTFLYGGVDDTRACSACTCGPPTGGSCAASYSAYPSTDGSCSGQPDVYEAPVTCAGVNDPTDVRLTVTPSPGSCAQSSVSPTGSAVPASPTTFCCLQ